MLRLITKGGTAVAEGKLLSNNLCKMRVRVCATEVQEARTENTYAAVKTLESWETWHKRFGHISYRGLEKLLKDHLVDGFNIDTRTPKLDCIACTEAKQRVEPHQKIVNRHTMPGELTHIDLWGKYDVTSINGNQYYILFLDDASRYMTTRFLKGKDEAAQAVKDHLTYLATPLNPCRRCAQIGGLSL
jgi:hypothetical protein